MSRFLLHLIVGPTGIGKTRESIKIARRQSAPVIVLDRVQCCPQLAVGSGRPTLAELQGTTRRYLGARPVSAGVIDADEAVDQLMQQIKELRGAGAGAIILEGGSISVLAELAHRSDWMDDAEARIQFLVERSARWFDSCVTRRVESMLGYDSAPSLVDELRALWGEPRARAVLKTVIGYREVIRICEDEGLTPETLTDTAVEMLRWEFFTAVRRAHLDYAQEQRRAFSRLLPELAALGCEIDLHKPVVPSAVA